MRHWGMEDEMSESEWSQWLADGEPRRESWGGGKYGGGKYGGGKYGGGKNGGFGGKNGGFKGGDRGWMPSVELRIPTCVCLCDCVCVRMFAYTYVCVSVCARLFRFVCAHTCGACMCVRVCVPSFMCSQVAWCDGTVWQVDHLPHCK